MGIYGKVYSAMRHIGWFLLVLMIVGMNVLPRKKSDRADKVKQS